MDKLKLVADYCRSISDDPDDTTDTDIEVVRTYCAWLGAKFTDEGIIETIESLFDDWPAEEIEKSAGWAFEDYIKELGRYDRPKTPEELQEIINTKGKSFQPTLNKIVC